MIKKFVFVWGTNGLHQNMLDALPSLRTVQRMIHADYHPIAEGQLQFDELVIHLTKHNAPFVVAISEDATRIIARVEYDVETNRMVGFVLLCDDNGMPMADSFWQHHLKPLKNASSLIKHQSWHIYMLHSAFHQLCLHFV